LDRRSPLRAGPVRVTSIRSVKGPGDLRSFRGRGRETIAQRVEGPAHFADRGSPLRLGPVRVTSIWLVKAPGDLRSRRGRGRETIAQRGNCRAAFAIGNRPRKPRRVHPPRHDPHATGIRLEHGRDHGVEHEHRLGLHERSPQRRIIFLRPDPGQLAFDAMQRTRMPPALGQAATTNLRRSKLVAWALLHLIRPRSQQSQVIERTDVLLSLVEQEVREPAHGLRQERLHVPRVGDDHVVGRKIIDGPAVSRLDLGDIPARIVECDRLAGADQFVRDTANPPARIPGEKVLHLITRAGQKRRQLGRVMIAATG
jgi:hypothetical protein